MQKKFCQTWGFHHYEYFSVAKMKFFLTFQLNFFEKPGVPHKNEMLFMEIGMSAYCYTQKTCVGVRASWDEVLEVGIFFVLLWFWGMAFSEALTATWLDNFWGKFLLGYFQVNVK